MILDSRDNFEIDDDKSRLDLGFIHTFLDSSYWAAGIPVKVVAKSIEGSHCYGVYQGETQVGFARVVTDGATFGYLCDVFIDPSHRGAGLGKWLAQAVMARPAYQGFRRWLLATHDAHELYRPFGFKELEKPSNFMEIRNKDVYAPTKADP